MSWSTRKHEEVTSAGSQVNGDPIRVGGKRVTVQILEPAAASLGRIEISNDEVNWIVATHEMGTDLTALGSGIYMLDQRAEFIRNAVLTDASQPRVWEFITDVLDVD